VGNSKEIEIEEIFAEYIIFDIADKMGRTVEDQV
jgi:hypothetical protein